MKPQVLVQSRMDSTRLPGKAVELINGLPSLSHVLRNIKSKEYTITVVTTEREIDDPIEAIAMSEHIKCYRHIGDPNDVLSRFYAVAKAPVIVRVTADCLGVNAKIVQETIDALKKQQTDYAYSGPEQGYPRGYGCEAFTLDILKVAYNKAQTFHELEHVTPYIRENGKWATMKVNRYDSFNLELNTQEDLERIRNVYRTLR